MYIYTCIYIFKIYTKYIYVILYIYEYVYEYEYEYMCESLGWQFFRTNNGIHSEPDTLYESWSVKTLSNFGVSRIL